jgi:hypothetical protein
VCAAVAAARSDLAPVRVVGGATPTPGYEANRRAIRPDGGVAVLQWGPTHEVEGPTDPDTGFIAFEQAAGEPVVMLVSYPCHNNACGTADGFCHRDVFGQAGDALRAAFPTLQATLFVEGACGNVVFGAPDGMRRHRGDGFARAGGRAIAAQIATAYRAASPAVAGLQWASRVLSIPDRPLEQSSFCHDGCRGDSEAALARARQRYDPERVAVAARGQTACPVEIAALSLGDVALVTNPAELFVEYGLEMKRRSPFPTTLVAELTNGYCGYVPTQRALARGECGGYETHRSVYTSRLAADGGAQITAAALSLLETLRAAS